MKMPKQSNMDKSDKLKEKNKNDLNINDKNSEIDEENSELEQDVEDNDEVIIDIDDLTEFNWHFNDYDNPKALMRYIKSVEGLCRTSIEYKNYVRYMKEELDLTNCAIETKIDITECKGVGIEFHHYPFNLYEIVETVLKKQTNFFQTPANTFTLCNEVMRLHWLNEIGLIPLSKTNHELAHSGELFINLGLIHGDIKKFIDDYIEFIDDDLLDHLKSLDKLSQIKDENVNGYILKETVQKVLLKGREPKIFESPDGEKKIVD